MNDTKKTRNKRLVKSTITLSKHEADLHGATVASPICRTDSANAKRFLDQNAGRLLFCPTWKSWLAWDGKRWRLDISQVFVKRLAVRWARNLWIEYGRVRENLTQRDASQVESFCKWANSSAGVSAMISLAQADPRVFIEHTELDAKPRLLNVRNGTLDLDSGQLRPHDHEDKLTQLAPVEFDVGATCPKWIETLELVFAGDAELITYVQTMLGYCLTGDTGEHFLAIWHGFGLNGKSTLWQVLVGILGDDYALPAAETLLLGDGNSHPTEIADLFGKRLVVVSEPEQCATLRESKVKRLTGDSVLTGRRMKENFWRFPRTHKILMATNYKPTIAGLDLGIWRRVKLVPFNQDLSKVTSKVSDYDKYLIANESSGILNWLLAGWQRYQQDGLNDPPAVVAATSDYRRESDSMAEWLHEYVVIEPGAVVTAKQGFESFREWQEQQGTCEKYLWTKVKYGKELAERFTKDRPNSGPYRKQWIYHGLRLKNDDDEIDTFEETQGIEGLPQDAPNKTATPIESVALRDNHFNMGQLGANIIGGPKNVLRGSHEVG